MPFSVIGSTESSEGFSPGPNPGRAVLSRNIMNNNTNNLESDPYDQQWLYGISAIRNRYGYIKKNIYRYYRTSTKKERDVYK